jgi:hypothetical protein
MSRFFLLKQLPPSLQWLGDTHTHEASERPSKTFCVCWQTETWEGWKWLKLSAVGKCVTSYLILEGPPQKRFLTFQINCDSRGGNELTNGKKSCHKQPTTGPRAGAQRRLADVGMLCALALSVRHPHQCPSLPPRSCAFHVEGSDQDQTPDEDQVF